MAMKFSEYAKWDIKKFENELIVYAIDRAIYYYDKTSFDYEKQLYNENGDELNIHVEVELFHDEIDRLYVSVVYIEDLYVTADNDDGYIEFDTEELQLDPKLEDKINYWLEREYHDYL